MNRLILSTNLIRFTLALILIISLVSHIFSEEIPSTPVYTKHQFINARNDVPDYYAKLAFSPTDYKRPVVEKSPIKNQNTNIQVLNSTQDNFSFKRMAERIRRQ